MLALAISMPHWIWRATSAVKSGVDPGDVSSAATRSSTVGNSARSAAADSRLVPLANPDARRVGQQRRSQRVDPLPCLAVRGIVADLALRSPRTATATSCQSATNRAGGEEGPAVVRDRVGGEAADLIGVDEEEVIEVIRTLWRPVRRCRELPLATTSPVVHPLVNLDADLPGEAAGQLLRDLVIVGCRLDGIGGRDR